MSQALPFLTQERLRPEVSENADFQLRSLNSMSDS